MKLSDFDFHLPEELVALHPARPRTASRLLVSKGSQILDSQFFELGKHLRAGDRLILNTTKVIPAKLTAKRRRISDQGETFAHVDVNLLSPNTTGDWLALAKPAKRVNVGETLIFSDSLTATIENKGPDGLLLAFNLKGDAFDAEIAKIGQMPLPPYIVRKRAANATDKEDYQTVFAKKTGAVAAPTASLHFDTDMLDALKRQGITFTEVTLHVGAGTFLPVKTDNVADHKMHSEFGIVSEDAAGEMRATKAAGGRIIPVGTTSLRLIETAAKDGQIRAWTGDTDIFIKPGFQFNITDGLITNFHLPKSTLLMLVSALVGFDHMQKIYSHAIDANYRFFSYGDASLLLPNA